MSAINSDDFLATPVGDLATRPAQWLCDMQEEIARVLDIAKAMDTHLRQALDRRYADQAHSQRLALGKDTGIVHFEDGPVRVSVDLPKKVEWDQAQLTEIARRIATAGDDPGEFLETSYRVPETRFNAWPESLKRVFTPARTLKTGKPTYALTLHSEVSP
jgi:hypothetical protein